MGSKESNALQGARTRRVALAEAMGRAEAAMAAPSASPTWRSTMTSSLQMVRAALDDHVSEVEGDAGLLAELRRMSPRLSRATAELEDEHPPLCRAADAALAAVSGDAGTDEVRALALDLLAAIARHRQRGADLVYEAYNVDIGGQ